MMMEAPLRLGVDLGGTKTEAVILRVRPASDEPDVLARVRVPTNRDEGYEHVVETVARVIDEVTRQAQLASPPAIGVGMPGNVTFGDPPLVKNSNTTCLNGRPFRRDLEARVGRSIAFANDANCFALAEATFGASRGADVSFGVIMGTGVGGGLVFRDGGNPRAWDGVQGIAGEWGHVSLEPVSGAPCYCGRRGCIEQMLSGPAIERAHAARSGHARPLIEIARDEANDAHARATIDEACEHFGRALSIILNVIDPEVVVLGGGVSNLDALYDRGRAALSRWVFNDEVRTRIVRHTLGDSAGVIGAALLR